jgi:predicted DCC family thiol-disulfide oxidoreductase YuxK
MHYYGNCELCCSIVEFIINRSRGSLLAFSAMQAGSFDIKKSGSREPVVYQTILLLEGGNVLQQSDAVIRLLEKMHRPWPLLEAARMVPRVVRDLAYRFVAKNRYRLFGRWEPCLLCVADEGRRFVR